MIMWRMAAIALLGGILGSSSAMAGLLHDETQGGTATVTGTVGSLSCTNATWKLTAVADPADVQAGFCVVPFYYVPTTVTLTLQDGSSPLSMTLLDPAGAQWSAFSVDCDSFVAGMAGLGFVPVFSPTANETGAGITLGGGYGGTPGGYNDLSVRGTWSGGRTSFWNTADSYSTSLGAFTLTSKSEETGTGFFRITSIPEPGSAALCGLAGVL